MWATRAFTKKSPPLLDQDTLAQASALEGRQRLTGAFLIELHRVRPDPNQPRRKLDPQKQWELAVSIEQHGILQPITVQYLDKENVYQVITGERRYQAAVALGLPAIPCWVRTPKSKEILVHQIIENWQRQDLEPLELARALALLRDGNDYTQKQIAQVTGKPESEISRLLSLLNLTPDVQAKADANKQVFTKSHLVALAKAKPAEQKPMAEAVEKTRMTAVETERMVQEKKAKATNVKTRGAPLTQRFRYLTEKAAVTLTFRRRNITRDDILEALDEARTQVAGEPTMNS